MRVKADCRQIPVQEILGPDWAKKYSIGPDITFLVHDGPNDFPLPSRLPDGVSSLIYAKTMTVTNPDFSQGSGEITQQLVFYGMPVRKRENRINESDGYCLFTGAARYLEGIVREQENRGPVNQTSLSGTRYSVAIEHISIRDLCDPSSLNKIIDLHRRENEILTNISIREETHKTYSPGRLRPQDNTAVFYLLAEVTEKTQHPGGCELY